MNGLVSLIFALVEFTLIIYVKKYRTISKTNNLFFDLLVLLFTYQVFEFLICGLNLKNPAVTYLAFVTITFMPPLGLYAVFILSGYRNKILTLLFLPALFFTVYYLFVLNEFEVLKCTPVYAAYNYPLGFLYGLFYYLPIAAVIVIAFIKFKFDTDRTKRKLWKIIFTGYSVTFIPGFIFTRLFDEMLFAVESILCKFAFILVWFIAYFIKTNNLNDTKIKGDYGL